MANDRRTSGCIDDRQLDVFKCLLVRLYGRIICVLYNKNILYNKISHFQLNWLVEHEDFFNFFSRIFEKNYCQRLIFLTQFYFTYYLLRFFTFICLENAKNVASFGVWEFLFNFILNIFLFNFCHICN